MVDPLAQPVRDANGAALTLAWRRVIGPGFALPRDADRRSAVCWFSQDVPFLAVVVPAGARPAGVRRCHTFLPLLPRMPLAVPDPADRCARRCSVFLPLPPWTRGCCIGAGFILGMILLVVTTYPGC